MRNNNNSTKKPYNKSRKRTSKKKRRRRKRILIYMTEGVLLLVLCLGVWAYRTFSSYNYEELKEEELEINSMEPEVEEAMKGYMTIAMFGVDARDNKTLGKGTHADTDIVCNINMDTGEIRMVSIYRDTYLNIKGDDYFNKLTQAYFEGGAQQAVNALNKNLDLNIKEYVTVNWKAVADAINILGGIDVDVSKSEFSQINGFITATHEATGIPTVHLKSSGPNHLDGVQAVAYARLRLMDTDYKRTERQREVIAKAMEKAKQADLPTLINLVNTVFPQVLTSLDKTDILELAQNVSKFHISETAGFPFDKEAKVIKGKGDCVIPLGLTQNVYQLHTFLFGTETYTASKTVEKLDQMIKNVTGMGDPKTTIKAAGGTSKTTQTTAATSPQEQSVRFSEASTEGDSRSYFEPEVSETDGSVQPESTPPSEVQ